MFTLASNFNCCTAPGKKKRKTSVLYPVIMIKTCYPRRYRCFSRLWQQGLSFADCTIFSSELPLSLPNWLRCGECEEDSTVWQKSGNPCELSPREVGWGDSWSMSELDFPLSELRKLEERGENFCRRMGLDTSPLRAPTNEIVLCCLLCLTSPETVPVRTFKGSYQLYKMLGKLL